MNKVLKQMFGLFLVVLSAGSGLYFYAIAASPPFLFSDDFTSGTLNNWGFVGTPGNGSFAEVRNDPSNPTNKVFYGFAQPDGATVGKAYVSKDFSEVAERGDIIEAQARYYIPPAYITGNMTMLDVECRDCGIPTKPGVRVWFESGQFSIDRSKIGIAGKWYTGVSIPTDPFILRLRMVLGEGDDGITQLYLNGVKVFEEQGTNIPLFSAHPDVTAEEYSYVQMGLTAVGSQLTSGELYMDDVQITVEYVDTEPSEPPDVKSLDWSSPPGPSTIELHGYAWSDNIGWISFNCKNNSSCGTSDYQVTVDATDGSLDGYAWSDNIGWIKFGGLGGFPEGNNGNVFVGYSGSNVYIYGWARACSVFQSNCSGTLKSNEELGGWDGWVSFNCDDLTGGCTSNPVYGPKLVEGPSSGLIASSEPYVWGGDVIGWITMSAVSFDFPYEPGPFACNHTPTEESLSQDMWGQITTTACTGARVCSETTYVCTDPVPPVLVDFFADSRVVRAGESTTINWIVTDANDCTVTSPSGIVGTGLSGSGSSGPINNLSNFELTCVPITGGVAVPVGTLTIQTVGTRLEI